MRIEIATEQDIEQVDKLVHACYRGQESLQGWTSEADIIGGCRTTPDTLRREMSDPNLKILKGTDVASGKLIACVLAHHQGDKMHVGMLCVQPNLQAQGIGKKMMTAVEDLAKELNCAKLKIDVISARKELVNWYERQGFERNGKAVAFPEASTEFGIPKLPLELMEMERLIN